MKDRSPAGEFKVRWTEQRAVVWDSWADINCHHCLVIAVMLISEQVIGSASWPFQGRYDCPITKGWLWAMSWSFFLGVCFELERLDSPKDGKSLSRTQSAGGRCRA